ncbi:hypothetical protein [uncultured Kriegella sp.]|uniref:hypothetical protein n=1 Tax=uncultured Kriegella sp. TaxID=1798910 RepID=UPI0030D9A627|tara:strand:- start:108558 stop:109703 length:1146 start_codon:yes stop_codon:yes gene_type:complete
MNRTIEAFPVEVKNEFINTIKLLLYKNFSELLEKLDFDNDDIYLNSIVFSYFNSEKDNLFPKEILEEILQGYFIKKEKVKVTYSFNKNNISYIPNMGYFKRGEDKPYEPILIQGDFEIVKEVHPTLEKYFVEFYKGHIMNQHPVHNSVWKQHYKVLFDAIAVIKKHLPDFYKELVFANKGIYLHDNSKILNFTSVETLGMLYLYVIEGNNLIYFIEELIHQGSHNYLYYVLHHRNEYFKIDVDHGVMRDYTKEQWDYRTIYGAFHGLFTVTKRVVCFDKLLCENVFDGSEKHELLGRLADQFSRFRTGLELLDFNEVYTEKGIAFYKEMDTKCETILNKYAKLESEFDLSNQDVDFRYDDFCKLNPLEDFLKMDESGLFNF